MRQNAKVKDGYHKRDYPEDRAKTRVYHGYQHVRDPAGVVFVLTVCFCAEEILGGGNAHLVDRKFAAKGLTAQRLYDKVTALLPDYPGYYLSKTGVALTPNIVYKRWHNKEVYQNGKTGTKGQNKAARSQEHYTCSELLRPFISPVDAWFTTGRPLTLNEMIRLGTE